MNTGWTFSLAPTSPDFSVNWSEILQRLPLLAPLANCPQEREYHAEGDVLTHTRMVCESLAAMEAWRKLDEPNRSILFAAALLHDVAKPLCTQTDTAGRITSAGHALKGSHLARSLAYRGEIAPLAAPFDQREQIASMVRYHGLPLNFLEKSDPQRAVITTSLSARCDLLSLLAHADVRGRICATQAQLLERIEVFCDFCQENQCLAAPKPFASDHARFVYMSDGHSGPKYVPFDDTRCEVTVVCGLPGAGKDSYIRKHLSHLPAISLDAIRHELDIAPEDDQGTVVAAAKERAREFLRASQNFVWNSTNITMHLRKPLIAFFAGYKARVTIVYVETPYRTLLDRNAGGRVPRNVIERLIDKLDTPTPGEAHDVQWSA
jgi:predicted kinase